jgi:hypothetical protein
MFARARHWSLSWSRSIQSIPSRPISLRSSLVLSTHLRLDLYPSGFPIKTHYAFLFSPMTATCPALGTALANRKEVKDRIRDIDSGSEPACHFSPSELNSMACSPQANYTDHLASVCASVKSVWRKNIKFQVCVNKMLRKMFGPKRDMTREQFGILHNGSACTVITMS